MLPRGVAAAFKLLGEVQARAPSSASAAIRPFRRCVAASLRGIPTALHEQNAVLGRANRMLAKRVTAIATSFETTKYLGGRARADARSPAIRCAMR